MEVFRSVFKDEQTGLYTAHGFIPGHEDIDFIEVADTSEAAQKKMFDSMRKYLKPQ